MGDTSAAAGDEENAIPEKPHPRLRAFIPKQQRDFGRLVQYDHLDPVQLITRSANPEYQDQFIEKIFTDNGTQEGCAYSTSSVCSDAVLKRNFLTIRCNTSLFVLRVDKHGSTLYGIKVAQLYRRRLAERHPDCRPGTDNTIPKNY